MNIWCLLGGIACLLYTALVGYFGGVKKSPKLLKLVKMKLGKNMSDETAVKWCIGASIFMLVAAIVLFVFGVIIA